MRRVIEGAGFHTITTADLKAEKDLSILNLKVGVPKAGTKANHALFRGLVLQQHLEGAEDALAKGNLDTFRSHVDGVNQNRK